MLSLFNHRHHKLISFLSILLLIVFLSLQWKSVLEIAVNNFTIRWLVRGLPDFNTETGLPQCKKITDKIPAGQVRGLNERFHFNSLITTLNLARLAWLHGDCNQAESNFQMVFSKSPGDPRAALWLFWLRNSSVSPESLVIPRKGLADIAWEKGLQAEKAGYFDSAADWYELSYRNVPDSSLSVRLLGLYQRIQKTEKAQEFLERVIEQSSAETPEYWWAVGMAAGLKEDWRQAAQAFEKGATLVNDRFDFLLDQGVALERLGDWQAVQTVYQQAINARPGNIYPYIGLGQLRRRVGDFKGALYFYMQAEQFDPTHFLPQFVLGELYFENNKLDEAQAYFFKSIEFEPRNAYSYYYLALISSRLGDINHSIEHMKKAVEISGGAHSDWFVMLGNWRLEAGDQVGALEAYLQAQKYNPTDLVIKEKINKLRITSPRP